MVFCLLKLGSSQAPLYGLRNLKEIDGKSLQYENALRVLYIKSGSDVRLSFLGIGKGIDPKKYKNIFEFCRDYRSKKVLDINYLPSYQAYIKMSVGESISTPFSFVTLPPPQSDVSFRQEIINWSQKQYARPREGVEEEIVGRWQGEAAGGS